ncbi:hypothetical protein [Yoonia sp. SS1-5]|uniref:Uncharacterized protein n=1 Tax=Yoonia rhodophyticola TaxID=3137370 RepID=A0AAN0MDS8_9RHOB
MDIALGQAATRLDGRELPYGVVWLRVKKNEVVAEIRRLTAIWSIPTIDEIEAELAAKDVRYQQV